MAFTWAFHKKCSRHLSLIWLWKLLMQIPAASPRDQWVKVPKKHCLLQHNTVSSPYNILMYTQFSIMKWYFKNIYTARASIEKHGTAYVWPRYLKWLEHSAWIRRLGVWVLLKLRHFLSQKLRHFDNDTCSRVENECCCPHTVNISNVNFIKKICTLSLVLWHGVANNKPMTERGHIPVFMKHASQLSGTEW